MNNHRLIRWLMWEVHGIEMQRKPPKKEHRGPARDWKYRAWIRTLPCVACGIDPSGEAAHAGTDGGMRQKSSDYSCIPLCPTCHRYGPEAYHAVGRKDFEKRRQLDVGDLVRRLNALWFQGRKQAS